MEIATRRLQLSRPTEADAVPLQRLWRDERVQRFLGGARSEENAAACVAAVRTHWEVYGFGRWVVRARGADTIIGLCGLCHLDDEIEVSYKFVPTAWGQGFATEAARASLTYGFGPVRLDRIVAIARVDNAGSHHVLEKLGARYERIVRKWEAAWRFYAFARTQWPAEAVSLAPHSVNSLADLPP